MERLERLALGLHGPSVTRRKLLVGVDHDPVVTERPARHDPAVDEHRSDRERILRVEHLAPMLLRQDFRSPGMDEERGIPVDLSELAS